MNTTDKIMAMANTYAASYGKALLEKLYGTSQSYTEQCEAEAFKNREALRAEIEALVRDAERLEAENAALRADVGHKDAYAEQLGRELSKADSECKALREKAAMHDAMQEKQP